MKHKKIKKTVQSRFKKINKSLPRLMPRFDSEAIHLFRLEVKHLHALLQLLSTHPGPATHNKLPKRLKRFYHLAGEIRNLQLHRQNIREILAQKDGALPLVYLDSLETAIGDKSMQAIKVLKGNNSFEPEQKRIIKHLPPKLGKKEMAKFAKSKVEKFWDLVLCQYYGDDCLHEVRKLLKTLLYTITWFSRDDRVMIASEITGRERIRSIAALLGKLQDTCTGIILLGDYTKRNDREQEKLMLLDIEKQWLDEKQSTRKQILNEIFNKSHRAAPAGVSV